MPTVVFGRLLAGMLQERRFVDRQACRSVVNTRKPCAGMQVYGWTSDTPQACCRRAGSWIWNHPCRTSLPTRCEPAVGPKLVQPSMPDSMPKEHTQVWQPTRSLLRFCGFVHMYRHARQGRQQRKCVAVCGAVQMRANGTDHYVRQVCRPCASLCVLGNLRVYAYTDKYASMATIRKPVAGLRVCAYAGKYVSMAHHPQACSGSGCLYICRQACKTER